MQGREQRRELRSTVAVGDGQALVALLQGTPWPENVLQLIGDGLGAALAGRVTGAEEVARRCVALLGDRGWEDDEELADALESRLLSGPIRLLRAIPVDLDQLAGVLEGDPVDGGGRVDLRTGEVWPQPAIEYAVEVGEEDEDDEERWLWVANQGSRTAYRDMELFIDTVSDSFVIDSLSRALIGRGSFRRFKDELSRWPELLDQWLAYSEERHLGRARSWLAGERYTVAVAAARPGG